MERLGEMPCRGWVRGHIEAGIEAMERLGERPQRGWKKAIER